MARTTMSRATILLINEAGARPRHQDNVDVDRVFSADGNSHCIGDMVRSAAVVAIECCRRFVSRLRLK
jgi:hypothetical protein